MRPLRSHIQLYDPSHQKDNGLNAVPGGARGLRGGPWLKVGCAIGLNQGSPRPQKQNLGTLHVSILIAGSVGRPTQRNRCLMVNAAC